MTKERTATAAAKAGSPKPITTNTVKPKYDPPNVTAPRRGPQTGMGSMTDGDFLGQYANADELASFRATVEQRRAREAATWEFWRCSRCRTVLKDRPGATEAPCPRCNWLRRQDGGRLRRMSEAEVDQHLYQQAIKDKAEENQLRRAAFNERNLERAKAGLPPLTFEDFAARAKAEYEELKARGRDLGRIAAAYRRKP